MPSTFLGLNISYTGLVAANAGLNTTANNIANIETVGYSRQIVNQTASQAMRAYQSYGCVGAGVDTLGAERVRDIYYDEKYWTNNAKLGEYDKKAYYADLIQLYLKNQEGTNQVKGFTMIFSEFLASMEDLSMHTDDADYANKFIGKAGDLCEYFNILYNNFQKMQTDVNDEISICVDEVNSLAEQVAALNKQINSIEQMGNNVANELRDKRDLLVDQLSSIIDVECQERPIYDDGGNPTNMNEYIVTIAGGQLLVDGYSCRQIECVPRTSWQKVNQNDVDGLYDVVWSDTKEQLGLYANSVGGELKGLMDMRDGNNDEAFHGKIAEVSSVGDVRTVKVKVTDDYLMDMSKSTLPLTNGRIKLGGENYYYDNFDFEINDDGECYYTFYMSTDLERNPSQPSSEKIGLDVRVGERVNYQGIPYYMEQANEWVRGYAYAFNKIYGAQSGTDINGKVYEEGSMFLTGDNFAAGNQYTMDMEIGAKKFNSSADYGYYNLTGGNFNVVKAYEKDPSTFITHTVETDGPAKYDLLAELKDLATNKDKMSFRGCSAENFLDCIQADAALNAQSAFSFQDIYSSIEASIADSRYSISGVDNDEEGVNMIKFQNAYNLASKMISVLNECYNTLITQTGV